MTRKVMMVADGLGNGGAERQLCLLCRALPAGWAAVVWSLDGGRYEDELRAAAVRTRVRKRRFAADPGPVLDLGTFARVERPDILHSWGWMSAWAAEVVARTLRIPHVVGVIRRGMLPPRRTRQSLMVTKLGSRVIANSRAGLLAFAIPPERGRVLYNGFDRARLPAQARAARGGDSPFTAVMVATVDWRKDFDSFIEAAQLLVLQGSPGAWRFVVLGDGPDLPALRRKAADRGLRGVMELPGGVREVMPRLLEADAGVLMSPHGEGLSNSIMEYMASGLPVVCSDGGGNRELVQDGVTGFVVPARDPRSLADRLAHMAADRVGARAMGERGRQRILAEFSVERMGENAVAIYDELLR